ncbi:hypothetical protein BH18VER1_BH18VER1_11470 [soil metagenome]
MSTLTLQPGEQAPVLSQRSGSNRIAFALFALAAGYPIARIAMAAGANFGAVLNDASFRFWLGNSALVALAVSLLGVLIAAGAGYALSRSRERARALPQISFTGTRFLAGITLLLPLYIVAMTLGLINAQVAVVLLYAGTVLPLCILLVKRSYDAIPLAIEDAAALDGCSRGQAFRLVLLPLVRPALVVTALVSFITVWGEYFIAAVVVNDPPPFTRAVESAGSAAASSTSVGTYAAAALLVSAPALLLLLVLSRYRGSRMSLKSGDR